eukprot:6194636-Pleurochrysis_carterae.AAC.4
MRQAHKCDMSVCVLRMGNAVFKKFHVMKSRCSALGNKDASVLQYVDSREIRKCDTITLHSTKSKMLHCSRAVSSQAGCISSIIFEMTYAARRQFGFVAIGTGCLLLFFDAEATQALHCVHSQLSCGRFCTAHFLIFVQTELQTDVPQKQPHLRR